MAMLELQEKEAEMELINADKCREEMKQAEKAEEQRKGVTDKSQNMLNKIDRQTKRQPRLWELHNDTAQTVWISSPTALRQLIVMPDQQARHRLLSKLDDAHTGVLGTITLQSVAVSPLASTARHYAADSKQKKTKNEKQKKIKGPETISSSMLFI